jgi:phospholipid/cholesterol/gamma-HCH transport system substrate-binding protein
MPDQAKNMLIGIFVTAACAIVVFVLMFLHPSVGDEGKLLRVRFANIDKISIGTRVTFAGKPVGEVISIVELPDVDTERKSVNGFVYVYELTLRVDSSVSVFNTDEISSRTSGLLGEKSVAIIPRPVEKGEELRLVNNEIIYATETGSVEETLGDFKLLAGKAEMALDNFNAFMAGLKETGIVENLARSAVNVQEITAALNNPEQIRATLSNVHRLSESSQAIVERVRSGEGTIGQLVMRDDLYLRTNSLLSKAQTTMNDVNHYGVLFHLDKGWQRLRARRMNLLQKLSSPQEFRNYFNDEIDTVFTSLERVSMVLDQLNCEPAWCCHDLLQNSEYTKVYGELLHRIATLEEEVRLYNTQVVDCAVYESELQSCY